MSDALDALLKHCADNNRVCPMPGQWNTLGDMMIDLDRWGVIASRPMVASRRTA
jgi:hypothetical protein